MRINLTCGVLLSCAAACGAPESLPRVDSDSVGAHEDAAPHGDDDEGPSTPEDTTPAPGAPSGLLCDVEEILVQHCHACHGPTPSSGAPMRLVTLGDLRAPSPTQPGRPVYDLMVERVTSAEEPMPPRPFEALSAAQIVTLRSFAEASAPESSELCEPDAGSEPPPEERPLYGCDGPGETSFDLVAHGDGPDGKFAVDEGQESYRCFYFKPPWPSAEAQGVAFEPVIDDARVLHHWLLYAEEDMSAPDGSVMECDAAHPSAELLAGWAPGAGGLVLPSDVGLKLPTGPNAGIMLEIHYNNLANHDDARDRSGVRVCATDRARKHTAGMHWLGTENIVLGPGRTTISGTCRPINQEPVHIIAQWPHMHNLGRHMKVELTRAGGGVEVIHDEPFSFDNQVADVRPLTIQPGDSIRTSCTYENDTGRVVTLGENTGDEMCFNFVTAYPLGALVSAFPIGVSRNTCIELF